MITPINYPLPLVQGADLNFSLYWKVDGSYVDLTTYDARMQVRNGIDGSTAILDLDKTGGGIVLTALGKITIIASATITAAITGLETGEGVWDLELKDASGFVTNLIGGPVAFTQEVTR